MANRQHRPRPRDYHQCFQIAFREDLDALESPGGALVSKCHPSASPLVIYRSGWIDISCGDCGAPIVGAFVPTREQYYSLLPGVRAAGGNGARKKR